MKLWEFHDLGIEEMLAEAGITLQECTPNTWIIFEADDPELDGTVSAIERTDPGAMRQNEQDGWPVHVWYSNGFTIKEAAEARGVSRQAVRDILRDENRRKEIFPSAVREEFARGPLWIIHDPRDVLAWQPRHYPRD